MFADTALSQPEVVVGAITALVVAITTLVSTLRGTKHAAAANELGQEVRDAVGPANGATLQEILACVVQNQATQAEHIAYQHDRNHKILNALQRVTLRLQRIEHALGLPPLDEPTPAADDPPPPSRVVTPTHEPAPL